MEKLEDIINLIDAQKKKKSQNFIWKYLSKWPWFVAFGGVGLILGFLYFQISPPLYTVHSRILIESEDNSMDELLTFNNPSTPVAGKQVTNLLNTMGILQSFTLYKKALDNLNWEVSWYLKKTIFKIDLYNNEPFDLTISPTAINLQEFFLEVEMVDQNSFVVSANGKTHHNGYKQEVSFEQTIKNGVPFTNEFFNFTLTRKNARVGEVYLMKFNNLNALTTAYLKKTKVEAENEYSELITISIKAENVQREADFINELNNVLIEFGMENKYQNSEKSLEFIDSQLAELKKSLVAAEENVSSYRRNNQVMNMGQEAQVVYQRLEEIEQERYMTQLQIDYYTELQQYLDDSQKIEEMISPSVIGIDDPNLSLLLNKLTDLYSRRGVLLYSVKEANPTLVMLEKEIKVTRDALEETLKNQLKSTELTMASLEERYNTVQTRLRKLPETERNLVGIQRDFDLKNELFTYMLQKKGEMSVTKASIAPEVQIVDDALIGSAEKSGPMLLIVLAIGGLGGTMIPFLFITFFIFFSNKIETKDEIEIGSNIPVLDGIIKHGYKVKMPVVVHPRSGIAESFRGLRSNINTMLADHASRVISVNSLVPEEGKSFVSSNFAATLAKSNSKVLLIGADMHRPMLHKMLNIKEAPGLSEFFSGVHGFEDVVMPTPIKDLYIIQAGTLISAPSELIDIEKFNQLIERARLIYDYVVIDNAPLLLIPDAIATSNFSDISLFLLRMNHSHKDQIKQINKIVEFNHIKRAAIVINSAVERGYGYAYRRKYWKKGYGNYRHKMSIA